jgi:hypothetical protein
LERIFQNTENDTVKMADIKTVKVDRRSPYTVSFKMSYSQENYKKVVVNNRRKSKPAAAQLVLLPAYSKKLPIGYKKKADIIGLFRKKITFQNFMLLCMSPYFNNYYNIQGIIGKFVFCFVINNDNNVIINVLSQCHHIS